MEQNSSTMDIYERHNHACMIVRTARFDHHTIRGKKRKMSKKSGFIQEFKKFILRGNEYYLSQCQKYHYPYILIDKDYQPDADLAI